MFYIFRNPWSNPQSSMFFVVCSFNYIHFFCEKQQMFLSQVALNKAPGGRLHAQEEVLFPGFNSGLGPHHHHPSNARLMMSRSHHNLGQV